ncbi:MAG: 16S rRNA (uracil(1498)-N(3))-methyltransferase [Alphaproteobacteria bacterium]|nr:16S rRNA (uracil(1498)-N(3))-methyltransferase [Alphaproteobacteria bacterium]MBT7942604.1 16S rRNA (uracil(1498)-N(3))-methyltransferase [Alphaproteobacteria bacterium]
MNLPNSAPRLFVEAALATGAALSLAPSQAHYLSHVMRLKVGDGIILFNGRDGEWSGVVDTAGKKNCSVTVADQVREQSPEHGPWLAFAPVKKTRTDFIVEKATELGAMRLCPVFTRHTNSARVNVERMRAHSVEAAEQCRRLTVPEVASPESLEKLIAEWPTGRRLFVLDEHGAGFPIAEALEDLRTGADGLSHDCGFLVGPEGGFDVGELDALGKLEFVTRIDLGPRILRAETAALAALASWQAIAGSHRPS